METTAYIQIVTTADTQDVLQKIAGDLVSQKLAACAQISGPIQSVYEWKGQVETATEFLCVIKTRKALFDRIEAVIKGLHPYDTPEIIATPIICGSDDYIAWMNEALVAAP